MKKMLRLFAALLLPAALCLPAPAQEDGSTQDTTASASADTSAAPPAKKPARKTKAKKKKKKTAPAVSEYKFKAVETIPAYKFDKKANPILKKAKSRKAGKGKTAAPAGKLKPAAPIGEERESQQPPAGQEGQ